MENMKRKAEGIKPRKVKQRESWQKKIQLLDFAFQPIINIGTGKVFAVEALIRNHEAAGFPSIDALFDSAFKEHFLFQLDILLREKAMLKFQSIPFYPTIKLFYNYDPRTMLEDDYQPFTTEQLLKRYRIKEDMFCFEISEKYRIYNFHLFNDICDNFRRDGIKIAIDDFGSGFSGLELFYHTQPHYLKFDRFLIQDIHKCIKKKIICSQLISLANMLNALTIAEGVETEEELAFCRELGFHLVQGYYLQKPQIDPQRIGNQNPEAVASILKGSQKNSTDSGMVEKEVVRMDSIQLSDDFRTLFEKFHEKNIYNFLVVLDHHRMPVGIIHEKQIKSYVYSPYGKDLLVNKSIFISIRDFVTPCPTIDIHTPQDKILEIFVNYPDCEGVIITKNLEYYGFLSAVSLLNIIHEKNTKHAAKRSPLTKLPGNQRIENSSKIRKIPQTPK